jgi:hypothetical protein
MLAVTADSRKFPPRKVVPKEKFLPGIIVKISIKGG